ncbi:hypothetical protein N7526_004506 [Penicillium atrosanguineum]|nr:hypothetical protein N7526_004506 [Penicillium atrosanguineum]
MTSPDSQTEELPGELFVTITVQGREYQKYSIDNRIYFGPVDDEEAQRLDQQQLVFHRIFDHRLIFPPIRHLRRVLDCGHGSARWAVEVAEQHPDCQVIGVDIAPHMNPDDVPENLWLQVRNVLILVLSIFSSKKTRVEGGHVHHGATRLLRVTHPSPLINMVDDLNRPFTFLRTTSTLSTLDSLRPALIVADGQPTLTTLVLKPGGWVQMIEIYFNAQSDNGSLTDDHALRRWSTQYMRALEDRKDLRVASKLRNHFLNSGLVEVDSKMIQLPLSAWSNAIGRSNSDNIEELLQSLALYPLTQRLHMSAQSFDLLVEQAQSEARDLTLKAYFPLYVCIGRKRA